MATPRGEEKRIMPWTLTFAVYEDATGPGLRLSNAGNGIPMMFKIADRFLHRVYDAKPGELGWIGSYQDFGERCFHKRHPHIHLSLNGHKITHQGKISRLERLNLTGDGGRRIQYMWSEEIAAIVPGFDSYGNGRVEEPAVGKGAFYKWLKYETREAVDFRKVEYNRAAALVSWKSYHDGHQRELFKAIEFRDGLDEYRRRVQPHKGNRIHRAMGYMAPSKLEWINEQYGTPVLPTHPTDCAGCYRCDEFFEVPELKAVYNGWEEDESRLTARHI